MNRYLNYDVDDWVNLLTKELDLSYDEAHMLLHDINNLRGMEWIDDVKKLRNKELTKAFKLFVNSEDM